jgi:predicted NACHT family NTPase
MSKKDYKWKRFWCPRSGSINLFDGGYLYDPDAEWGKAYNPDLVSLEAIADVPCLVLLSEPGMGKTVAIEAAYKQVYEQTKNLEDICLPLFRLGDYGSDTELCTAIFRSNAFQEWLSGTHKLYLFLDSLDEGLLSIKTLVGILKREINDLPCDRLSQLLEELLKQGVTEAGDFARSLIIFPLPSAENERDTFNECKWCI